MTPLVTIIIPHFNRAELLQQTLTSLCDQSIPDWEAVVVDDGSSAEQWDKARQFVDSRVTFVQRQDGIKGPSRCRNIGLAESTSRFVMFVDSDDCVAPWSLEQRIAWMDANPECMFGVFPVMLFSRSPGDTDLLWNRLDGDDDLTRFLRADPPWHTSSPLWRRHVIEDLAGFNESIMYGDDTDLHIRALLARVCYGKSPESLPDVFIRRGDSDRITNSVSDQLLDSRFMRLKQGSELVKLNGSSEHQRIWEGQYFVEAEFLLFNVPSSKQQQSRVLSAWKQTWKPRLVERLVADSYFSIARLSKQHAYILLRLARRAAMLILPASFFARAGSFESETVSMAQHQKIQARLSKQVS